MAPKRAKIMAASHYLYTSVAGELSEPAAPFVECAEQDAGEGIDGQAAGDASAGKADRRRPSYL